MIEIKIKPTKDNLNDRVPGNQIPWKPVDSTDAGYDLKAWIEEPIELLPSKHAVIPCGFFMELPNNIEAQIRSRSGLAAKNGIMVLNSPGTIDPDYRGEIKVILMNLGDETFTINPGMRIAQMIFSKVLKTQLKIVSKIDENTPRGDKGFGSSSVN